MKNGFMMTQEEYAERYGETTDLTVDGKCSQCGGCCSNRLPLTNQEVKELKELIKKKRLKPISHLPVVIATPAIDMMCPFMDQNNQCVIYEQRPMICKVYCCNKSEFLLTMEVLRDPNANQLQIRMLREELFD